MIDPNAYQPFPGYYALFENSSSPEFPVVYALFHHRCGVMVPNFQDCVDLHNAWHEHLYQEANEAVMAERLQWSGKTTEQGTKTSDEGKN